ncbi:hypothetical protein [Urbifossiella limnaea]|nr:hypothetical protein [Urbifossiella limnaea]
MRGYPDDLYRESAANPDLPRVVKEQLGQIATLSALSATSCV